MVEVEVTCQALFCVFFNGLIWAIHYNYLCSFWIKRYARGRTPSQPDLTQLVRGLGICIFEKHSG